MIREKIVKNNDLYGGKQKDSPIFQPLSKDRHYIGNNFFFKKEELSDKIK
jgi:hypothetical protein